MAKAGNLAFRQLADLAIMYRTAQLTAHNAHNLCGGETFLSDHGFFGDLYGAYESAYDDLIERVIGLGGEPDLQVLQKVAVDKLQPTVTDFDDAFGQVLQLEQQIQDAIEGMADSLTQGTLNLVAGLADQSEVRCYKIRQRTKEEVETEVED